MHKCSAKSSKSGSQTRSQQRADATRQHHAWDRGSCSNTLTTAAANARESALTHPRPPGESSPGASCPRRPSLCCRSSVARPGASASRQPPSTLQEGRDQQQPVRTTHQNKDRSGVCTTATWRTLGMLEIQQQQQRQTTPAYTHSTKSSCWGCTCP